MLAYIRWYYSLTVSASAMPRLYLPLRAAPSAPTLIQPVGCHNHNLCDAGASSRDIWHRYTYIEI